MIFLKLLPRLGYLTSQCLGLFLATRMFWLNNFSVAGLPCSRICNLIEKDRLAIILGLPLSLWGATGALACLLLYSVYSYRLSEIYRRLHLALNLAGSMISLLLVFYILSSYGDLCPWCTASAFSWLLSSVFLGLDNTDSLDPRRTVKLLPVAIILGIGITSLLEARIRAVNTDFSKFSFKDHQTQSHQISESFNGGSWIVFVDLDCGTCRKLLLKVVSRGPTDSVYAYYSAGSTDYSKEAALVMLEPMSTEERTRCLADLLGDESRTITPLYQLRTKYGLPAKSSSYAKLALQDDQALIKQLNLLQFPIVVQLKGARLKVSRELQ